MKVMACVLLMSVVNCFAYANEALEKGFYSLSALRYFVEGGPQTMTCDGEDVEFLWSQTLAFLPDNENLYQAHELYVVDSIGSRQTSIQILGDEWEHMQCSLLEDTQQLFLPKEVSTITNNPDIPSSVKKAVKKYLMRPDHPCFEKLQALCLQSRITANRTTIQNAGFTILDVYSTSGIVLVKHRDFPGYIFKIYLDDTAKTRGDIPGWRWLTDRCVGADNIRRLMARKNFQHFVVPEKALYAFPQEKDPPWSTRYSPQPVMLAVTEMDILPHETVNAWATLITKRHLDELYAVISLGYGSVSIIPNIPYTKSGKFAFIDTEYPKRKLNFGIVSQHLSPEMRAYWELLVRRGGA